MPPRKKLKVEEVRQLVTDSNYSDSSSEGLESESENDAESDTDSDTSDTEPTVPVSVDGWGCTPHFQDSTFRPSDSVGPQIPTAHLTQNSDVLEYFAIFWGDDVWQMMVDMTNKNADNVKKTKPNDYYARAWKQLTIEELKAFIGVRLSMEYGVIKRRYESYFSRKPGFLFDTPGYREVFDRDRFLAVWKFLHIVDETSDNTDKTDKLYKVRPLLDHLQQKFQENYKPVQNLSLDEGMIPTKNRLAIKQYLPKKPVKWGIKTFMLCESETGYICNFEVYTGKSTGLFIPELGATGSVVARLTTNVQNQNYKVYTDRFYTSPSLSRYLLQKGIHSCGTVLVNRKGFPKNLIRRKKDMKRGDCDFRCSDDLSAVVWCDRSPLYFLSTFDEPQQMTTVKRKNKDGTVVQVQCPLVVANYTKYMGGCDLNDQLTKLYKSRRHYRWPRRLIMKCIVWTCYNAYVIQDHFKQHAQAGRRLFTFGDFMDSLVLTLIGNYRSPASVRRRSVTSQSQDRLQNVGIHVPERPAEATGNHRCVVCREKRKRYAKAHPEVANKDITQKDCKTVFRCTACREYLCIREGATCWTDYHGKVEFWR